MKRRWILIGSLEPECNSLAWLLHMSRESFLWPRHPHGILGAGWGLRRLLQRALPLILAASGSKCNGSQRVFLHSAWLRVEYQRLMESSSLSILIMFLSVCRMGTITRRGTSLTRCNGPIYPGSFIVQDISAFVHQLRGPAPLWRFQVVCHAAKHKTLLSETWNFILCLHFFNPKQQIPSCLPTVLDLFLQAEQKKKKQQQSRWQKANVGEDDPSPVCCH